MSSDEQEVPVALEHLELRPHEDARSIIRLFQCPRCSYPLRQPLILPCGGSVCKACLPPRYDREHITYPQNAARVPGFVCPLEHCRLEHPLADCSVDVTLNKLIDVVRIQISGSVRDSSCPLLLLRERFNKDQMVDSSLDVMPRSRILRGGHLSATFAFADMGELNYYSEVEYSRINSENADDTRLLDIATAGQVKDVIRGELECQVCYGLMLDPLTTPCGHTFCRNCVVRVLDHSTLCPACRRPLALRPGALSDPTNASISHILQGLFTVENVARSLAVEQEEAIDEDLMLPLFPCTLAYPLMPTFLHIFEPRYRLMMRRCIDSGSRKFGMLMYNSRRIPQGELGESTFMQYGTILNIQRVEVFPDGRSLIETQGVSRFKVVASSIRDGYSVGQIQRIDDIPLAEEEGIEAQETSGPLPDEADVEGQIRHMSTQRLLQYGLDFISGARARSAPWLHERVLAAYGQPPIDPAIFPYWFASVLPIAEDEKYMLLPTTSVRERLQMTVRWIQRLEAARCVYEAALANRIMQMTGEGHEEEGFGEGAQPRSTTYHQE